MHNPNAILIANILTKNGTENVKKSNKAVIEAIHEIIVDHNITGFVDLNDIFYLYLAKFGEICPADSEKVVKYFTYFLHYEHNIIGVNGRTISDFIGTIANLCKGHIQKEELNVRTQSFVRWGGLGEKIYLNLEEKGNYVEVDSSGWRLINEAPVLFRQSKDSQPIATPQKAEMHEIMQLQQFLNCTENQFKMLICFIVHAMFPENYKDDKIILALEGKAGSAKSTISKVIRSLLDPNTADTVELNKKSKDLMVRVNNQWLVVFDNVSEITADISDVLCRISTKAGHSERRYYTNNEIISYSIKRPMVMNGIAGYIEREDLLDRCLNLCLPVLEKRESPTDFWRKFEEIKPRILGALLSILAEVLRILPEITVNENFRMSDFAKVGCAVEKCLNWGDGFFVKTYQELLFGMAEENLEQDDVGSLLVDYLKNKSDFLGNFQIKETPKWWFCELRKFNERNGNVYGNFPKDINVFAKKLYRLEPTLRKNSIYLQKGKSGDRFITLGKK